MQIIIISSHFIYKFILRPIIFIFDSEKVHHYFVNLGEAMGRSSIAKFFLKLIFVKEYKILKQRIFGINFSTPIGLAAGFDYNGSLTQILPFIGFGFGSVGTITNNAYEGNPYPRLGRLIKSRSLLVYKGFKNEGIKKISLKLKNLDFSYPVGLSIGKTNSLNDQMSQKEAISDIVSSLKEAERSKLKISYYELNISCPNIFGNVSFYPSKNLTELLEKVCDLRLSKPLFIKMPISKTDKEVLEMLKVIVKFPVTGVIIGNTQNNRKDISFVKEELKKYPVGNFSGKPTEKRSNELIRLTYKNFGKKLIIVGCGGVFNAKDAYKKIKLGASLIQLITGLVFEGPQLVSDINYELNKMLKKDGFKNISDAVGASI